ncbi:MAG: hypothetical protein JRI68_25740, partial [Deltaproteobacteria bacterium]|nr:hypothetical protein [Deltaproteobacteria bacterium]
PAAEAPAPTATSGTPTTGAPFDQATPQQTAEATEAYKAGVEALDGQQYDEALAKFRESYGIVASPNSRLMIVRALSESGKYTEAYEEAVLTVAECEAAAAKDAKYDKAVVGAQEELAALEAKIARVTVTVTKAPEGATLSVAGQPIDSARWGQALVVAPGEVWVTLTTKDGEETQKVTVAPGGSATIEIAPPAPKVVEKKEPDKPKVVKQDEEGFDWANKRMWAYVAGGVGVLGFTGLGVFGMLSNSRMIRLEDQCDKDDDCDPELVDEANAGKTYTMMANLGLVVGIVGVSAGAGLFVWDMLEADDEQGAAIVRPRVSIGPGSLAVSGSF